MSQYDDLEMPGYWPDRGSRRATPNQLAAARRLKGRNHKGQGKTVGSADPKRADAGLRRFDKP